MKTLTLTQLFSHLSTEPAPTLPWQRELGPGSHCVISIKQGEDTCFMYLLIKEPVPQVPPGYLFGDCYSDLSPDAAIPGVAAVHPSEVLQPITAAQFEAARRCGFRSAAEAVMHIINYSSQRGEA